MKSHWRYVGIAACLVGIVLVLVWSASSWILIVKYWHISVVVAGLLSLRVYRQWRQEQLEFNQAKIEVLCVLDEAQRALNEIQLMRLIEDEDIQARLPRVLEVLVDDGQIECIFGKHDHYRFSFVE